MASSFVSTRRRIHATEDAPDRTTVVPPVRGLNARYVIALLAIAALSIGAHLAITSAIDTQTGGAAEINVSGRQRMLSQRIALYVAEISAEGIGRLDADVATLTGLTDLMADSHEGLLDGNEELGLPGDPSAELRNVYFGTRDLERQVVRYVSDVRSVIAMPADELDPESASVQRVVTATRDTSPDGLLDSLDRAVAAYQTETESEVDDVGMVARIVLVITLLALAFEGLFVFRALIRRIRRQTMSVTAARSRLQSVLDNALVGVITLDDDGMILDVNATAEALLESSLGQLASLDVAALATTGSGSEALHRMVDESRSGDVDEPTEVELRRGDTTFSPT